MSLVYQFFWNTVYISVVLKTVGKIWSHVVFNFFSWVIIQ